MFDISLIRPWYSDTSNTYRQGPPKIQHEIEDNAARNCDLARTCSLKVDGRDIILSYPFIVETTILMQATDTTNAYLIWRFSRTLKETFAFCGQADGR